LGLWKLKKRVIFKNTATIDMKTRDFSIKLKKKFHFHQKNNEMSFFFSNIGAELIKSTQRVKQINKIKCQS